MTSLAASSEQSILSYLAEQAISFERFEHSPIATMEEARARPGVRGEMTKNLLLRANREDRYFLIVATHDRRIDISGLQRSLGIRKLSFATADELGELLAVTAGSVTLLALINDRLKRVTLVIDAILWNALETQHHPLVNTSTIVLSHAGLRQFLTLIEHEPTVIEIP